MYKRIISFICPPKRLVAFLLFLSACAANPDTKAHEATDAFLTAYFTVDFERLIPLCATDSELKSDMERNARALGWTPQQTDDNQQAHQSYQMQERQQALKRRLADLADYNYRIDHVQLNHTKDSAFVSYSIFTPELPDGIASRLTLIKEKEDWRVAKLL